MLGLSDRRGQDTPVSGFKGKYAIYLHSRENLPYMEKFGKFGPSRPRPARHPTPIILQAPGFVNTQNEKKFGELFIRHNGSAHGAVCSTFGTFSTPLARGVQLDGLA